MSLLEDNLNFGFAGAYTDRSGLSYMNARYYNPATGSFLSRDPVQGVLGGSSISFNPYPYANNNPVNFTDPTGEFACLGLCVAAMILIGGTIIGGVTWASWDVGVNQGFSRHHDFSAIDWGRTGQAFKKGANTGLLVSSVIAGGVAYKAAGIGANGLKGWQAFRALAPYNAIDLAWGAGVDMALNGQSFGSATLWNVAAFGAGEVLGAGIDAGARLGGRALRSTGSALQDAGSRFARTFDLGAVGSGPFPVGRRSFNPTGSYGESFSNLRRNLRDRLVRLADLHTPRPFDPEGRRIGWGWGRNSRNQHTELRADLNLLRSVEADQIRINQQQVTGGRRVGINRPDLQYTIGGQRYYIEYESLANPRGYEHAQRILANDPAGIVIVKLIPWDPNFQAGQGVIWQLYNVNP